MDRPAIHALPKAAIRRILEAMGLTVEPAGALARYDFLVARRLRIAIRVAFPSSSRRRVRVGRRCCPYV